MEGAIGTAYCRSCGELFDVLLSGGIVGDGSAVLVLAPDLGCCSKCQTRLVYWRDGQRCPRCRGTMQEVGECIEVN